MPTSTTNYGFLKPLPNDPIDEDLWGGYLNENFDQIDTLFKQVFDALAAAIPVGVYVPYAPSVAPAQFMFIYGQAVSRATYANLFTAIGTSYGAGDGSTTFNVPDLRGRVPAGRDNMGGSTAGRLTNSGAGNSGINGTTLGAAGGADRHAQTTAELVNHTHNIILSNSTNLASRTLPSGVVSVAPLGTVATEATGGGDPFTIVQPTIVTNYIIRY